MLDFKLFKKFGQNRIHITGLGGSLRNLKMDFHIYKNENMRK